MKMVWLVIARADLDKLKVLKQGIVARTVTGDGEGEPKKKNPFGS